MSVAKIIELSSTSPKSFEDAIAQGVQRAEQSVRNVKGAWVSEQKVKVAEGNVVEYRVDLKVSFVLES